MAQASALACQPSTERRDVYGRTVRKPPVGEAAAAAAAETIDLTLWRFPGIRIIRCDFCPSAPRPHLLSHILESYGESTHTRRIRSEANPLAMQNISGEVPSCLARREHFLELRSAAHISAEAMQFRLQAFASSGGPLRHLKRARRGVEGWRLGP